MKEYEVTTRSGTFTVQLTEDDAKRLDAKPVGKKATPANKSAEPSNK